MAERRYRVVYPDREVIHVAFPLAQGEFNREPEALHFDRFVAGGWIPLGWRGPKPDSEPPALTTPSPPVAES